METPFLGPWGRSRSPNLSGNELINLFVNIVETKDGKAVGGFYSAPGLDFLVATGAGGIRPGGLIVMSDLLWAVSGGELWSVTANLQATLRGTLKTTTGYVSMIQNGTQLAIFDGQAGYLISNQTGASTLGDATAETEQTNAPGANSIFLRVLTPAVAMTLDSVVLMPAATSTTAKFTAVVYDGITAGAARLAVSAEIQGCVAGQPFICAFATPLDLSPATGYAVGFITDTALALQQVDTNVGGSRAANTYASGAPATLPAMTAGQPDWLFWGITTLAPFTLNTLAMPFPNPVSACYQDGFGLLSFGNLQDIAQSNLRDLSIWDPVNFSTADADPGDIVRLFDIHEEVFILKQASAEVWVNAGLAGFAFQRLTGVKIEAGIVAIASAAKVGESLLFVSRNDQGQGIVVQLAPYQPKPVSITALDAIIQAYPDIGDAIGYAYQLDGHAFYVLVFPESNASWALDLTSTAQLGIPCWHRLTAFGTTDPTDSGLLNRHWGNAFVPFQGSGTVVNTPTTYCADPVLISQPVIIESAAELANLGASFTTAVFSINLDAPDSGIHGIIFSNQTDDQLGSHNPGLIIAAANDATNSPQITIGAWDVANAAIVLATYDFATWAAWVNVLVSIDTATQTLQVYANTVVGGLLVETALTPVSITWSSSNPIGNPAAQPWHLVEVT